MKDLSLVIPVYNEDANIVKALQSWCTQLSSLAIDFMIIVINDGSKDSTAQKLATFQSHPRFQIIHQSNKGHGPTILHGYGLAVKQARWVFQCDSDNEISPTYFSELWKRKEKFKALFGVRLSRQQSLLRRCISLTARLSIRLLFSEDFVDINTPYRLMRSDFLKEIIEEIPKNTFAPNVLLTGAFLKSQSAIYAHPVENKTTPLRKGSLGNFKIVPLAVKSFFQTLEATQRINHKLKKE